MISYDKGEIKKSLTIDNIFELLSDWGGDPQYTSFGLIATTICHNLPGEGSKKLYYYDNDGSGLFHCYTGCEEPSFDIFQLTIKVFLIQRNIILDLNEAVRYIAKRFGILNTYVPEDNEISIEDWKILNHYSKFQTDTSKKPTNIIELKKYDDSILNNLNYRVKLTPWLNEGITQEVLDKAQIGFYPGGDQITIPHFDINGNFIGLRGRTLCAEEAELYGKYRPLKAGLKQYNHPLGMNLYNLNNSKENIKLMQKAIVFESEKSSLLYQSYFGIENDISVACCGSNLTSYQFQLLVEVGAKEIIIAFDRQFEDLNTEESKRWIKKLTSINDKYKNYANISIIFDKHKITSYKSSPIDEGPEKFIQLFKERIFLNN